MTHRIITLRLTGKGWFLFCPVWLPEGWETSPELAPVPRWRLWPLLSLAMVTQQFINFLLALVHPEACGFWCYAVPMRPRTITLRVDY